MSSDLFVISAPSGSGKTTLARRLLADLTGMEFSVSYTTRKKRPGERDGVDYHFVDDGEFDRMLKEGEFLEWAEVHGRRYGTSQTTVDRSLADGRDVLLDIDTQGAASVRSRRSDAVLIFILPPDLETLRERIAGRGAEDADETRKRLEHAREEVKHYSEYDYIVVNDKVDEAVRLLEAIVTAHRHRRHRQDAACLRILNSFERG